MSTFHCAFVTHLLFCYYEGKPYAIIPEAKQVNALQLYNKLGFTYPLAQLSVAGYDNLYLKFLELRNRFGDFQDGSRSK